MPSEREIPRVRRGASRLPYIGALILMGAFVALAWLRRDSMEPVLVGRPAPEFQATNLEGEPVRLSEYRGKVILVNVWATWCDPCRDEMPSIERLYHEVRAMPGGEDFEILAVSVDASRERPDPLGRSAMSSELAAFAEELGLTFPIVHDPRGRIQGTYQTTGVPESFLIGRDGVIYLKFAGPTEWDAPQYVEQIRRLLG